jgi:Zn-dependent oligopeptidase
MPYDYTAATVDSVRRETREGIARAEELVAQVEGVSDSDDASFDDVLLPLDQANAAVTVAYGRGAFMARVHTDPEVRDVAQEAEEELNKLGVELPFREGLYRAVRRYADTDEARALGGERRRLLEHWLRDFRRAGHELDADARAEVQQLRGRLVELETSFQRNIDEAKDHLDLTREELAGLPDSYVARLAPGEREGTYRVTMAMPDWRPFLENAERRDLREQLQKLVFNRAAESNRQILEEALRIRADIARILGYPSWAHFAIEMKMAADPAAVRRFYDDLVEPLQRKARPDLELLSHELEADGQDGPLQSWDWRYYDTRVRTRDYGVDPNAVAEYFPLERALTGMLELTSEVFGLDYSKVEATDAWHPDVVLYEAHDRETGDLVGHFYMDLFPRDGKFSHAAAFPLVIGHRRPDGVYEKPITAIVMNVPKPTAEQPSLLKHTDLLTLFHEFGHVLHMTVTKAEFTRFSGASTEWDFVEAPSQIMEHWAWNADVLRRFAVHHKTGEPIPEELVDKLVAARDLNLAVEMARQCSIGLLDFEMHERSVAPDESELDEINRRTWEITGLPFPEGTFYPASFGHLLGGYDAGYYGYLWSRVFGDDMFSRFEAEGVTSPDVGRDYRREVLEPNGSKDPNEMLRAFLGREPSNAAFLRQLGLPAQPAGSR